MQTIQNIQNNRWTRLEKLETQTPWFVEAFVLKYAINSFPYRYKLHTSIQQQQNTSLMPHSFMSSIQTWD
jgi:uncharacterized membrane protein YadS